MTADDGKALTLGYLESVARRRGDEIRFDRKPGIGTKVWFE